MSEFVLIVIDNNEDMEMFASGTIDALHVIFTVQDELSPSAEIINGRKLAIAKFWEKAWQELLVEATQKGVRRMISTPTTESRTKINLRRGWEHLNKDTLIFDLEKYNSVTIDITK